MNKEKQLKDPPHIVPGAEKKLLRSPPKAERLELNWEEELEVLEELGRGAKGIVHRARHKHTNQTFAVKHVKQSAPTTKESQVIGGIGSAMASTRKNTTFEPIE